MTRKKTKGKRTRRRSSVRLARGSAFSENLFFVPEPALTFGYGQAVEDPRDGLMLFGPLDEGAPYGIRIGVIGTKQGIQHYRAWAQRIQGPLADKGSQVARPPYPGFQAVFGIAWGIDPAVTLTVPDAEIQSAVLLDDRHQRVFAAVGVYADRILTALRTEEPNIDVWFVAIPDIVHQNCRPRSRVSRELQIQAEVTMTPRMARRLRTEPSIFQEDNVAAVAYQYDVDFHNQLKARLLGRAPTQIVRESTIAPPVDESIAERPRRDMAKYQAALAWNLTSTGFYKAGGRPWKIDQIREGVCYVGLAFKKDETHADPRTACCAAQMFLDSGDGLVFKGAVGPWFTPDRNEYHLSRAAAKELVGMAVDAYRDRREDKQPPRELFIHGRVWFGDDEWKGFCDAVDTAKTKLVGIKIRDDNSFRVYRFGRRPVIRGVAYVLHPKAAYLWTRGYVPRLRTYVGREVPRPLRIDVARGECAIETVLSDVLALTKLNYNACIFADGSPVTLRFADAVGEILTAGPVASENPLPFKHYI